MASYPLSIKSFRAKQDFEDINYAEDLNEIQDEIVAIETTLGINPYLNLPYTSLGQALTDLYQNKAPTQHNHIHADLQGDTTGNDHTQYALLSGAAFTGPVSAPPARLGSQLATLGQLQAQGIADEKSVQAEINTQLASRCQGAPAGSVSLIGNPTHYGWTLIGGYNEGCTDASGLIRCTFTGAFTSVLQSFSAAKAITGLGSNAEPSSFFPCSVYNPATTDMTLEAVTLASGGSATLLFSNHTSGAPLNNQHVAFSWHALGI